MKKIITIIILLAVIAAAIIWSVRTSIENKNNTAQTILWNTLEDVDGMTEEKEGETYDNNQYPDIVETDKRGCLQATACDYVNRGGNMTEYELSQYKQGPSCVFAWYQTKSGANFTPAFGGAQVDTIKIPPVKKSQVCSVRGGCTEGLFVKGRVVYYDGRTPAAEETDPMLHAYVNAADARKYAGTNACDGWRQLDGEVAETFHSVTTAPKNQTGQANQINKLR